jgi:hypothetical protein
MTFDTDQATVFQIRRRHRNEEVRELIPSDYAGVMVTDRGGTDCPPSGTAASHTAGGAPYD